MAQKEKIIYTDEDSQDDFSPLAGKKAKLKKLKEKLKGCQKEKGEYLDLAQRAKADLINYRRRQEELITEFRQYSQENLIREILPVLDSLRIGQKQIPELKPIKKQLETILEKYNLKEIKTTGERFNPRFHEAIEIVESDKENGAIAEEVQRGYMLGDKILRPSRVKVAK